jgi:hypothetical protein
MEVFFLKDVNVKKKQQMYRSLVYPQEPVSCLDQLYERDRQLLESHAGQDFNGCEHSLGFAINRNKYLSCENERLVDELNRLRMVVPMASARVRVTEACVPTCYNRFDQGDVWECLKGCPAPVFECGRCTSSCAGIEDGHRRERCRKDCIEDCE